MELEPFIQSAIEYVGSLSYHNLLYRPNPISVTIFQPLNGQNKHPRQGDGYIMARLRPVPLFGLILWLYVMDRFLPGLRTRYLP